MLCGYGAHWWCAGPPPRYQCADGWYYVAVMRTMRSLTGAVLGLVTVCCGLFGACSPSVKDGPGMYDRSELQQFVEDTTPEFVAPPEYELGYGDKIDIVFLYHNNRDKYYLLFHNTVLNSNLNKYNPP